MPDEQLSNEGLSETHDLQSKVSQWCDAAFERHGHGERFTFQMTVHALPPMAPGQPPIFQPAVIFWLPGPALGTVMSGAFTINQPHSITKDEIDKTVAQACEQMLQARSAQLREIGNGHGDGPPPPLYIAH